MTNILVTGLGSVGIATIRKFALDDFGMIAYDLTSPRPQVLSALEEVEDKVKYVQGDVRDQFRLLDVAKDNEVEGIIHTAALTGRGSGIFYPTAQFEVNAGGVLSVLETSRILDLGRVVFTSSAYIFWNKVELLKETEPINPKMLNTIYNVAKYSGEMLMHAYHNIYSMDTVTCRLHNVYGIAEINPKGIGSLLWGVMKGENVVESTGADNEGDYSYSGDIADGIHILYNTKKVSDPRIYNLSDGKIRKLGEIVEIINEMGPGNVELGPGKGGKYPGSSPLICDISRAKELGYRPRPIEESLNEYAAWIKSEMKRTNTS